VATKLLTGSETAQSHKAGRYLQLNSAIGRLWTELSDQEWHSVRDLESLIHPLKLDKTLYMLRRHDAKGCAVHRVWPKSHDWIIEENESQIRMLLSLR
jgi:hypothetical protein